MKLRAELSTGLNTVTAYGPGFVQINQQHYPHSVLFFPEGEVQTWPVAEFDQLEWAHFSSVLARRPEILLLGSGTRQKFLAPKLVAALSQAHIGVESMDTPAACRTYNILMSEGRQVAAAFIVDSPLA